MTQKTGVVERLKSKLANLKNTSDHQNTRFEAEINEIKQKQQILTITNVHCAPS